MNSVFEKEKIKYSVNKIKKLKSKKPRNKKRFKKLK